MLNKIMLGACGKKEATSKCALLTVDYYREPKLERYGFRKGDLGEIQGTPDGIYDDITSLYIAIYQGIEYRFFFNTQGAPYASAFTFPDLSDEAYADGIFLDEYDPLFIYFKENVGKQIPFKWVE